MKKYSITCIIIIILSTLTGLILQENFFGIVSLVIGCLNVYIMSQGKWYHYCLGIVYGAIYGVISYINGLYGVVILSIIFYEPIQILGLINWIKHKEKDVVLTKSLNKKQEIILLFAVLSIAMFFGKLLSIIPKQNLAFLDSTSQILNISANLLLFLRYKECWQVWIIGSSFDLIIWIINYINNGEYSLIMLITSIIYLIMNIYGCINWIKLNKNQQDIKKINNNFC